jgi:tripartite-type tricarboxylate transporter receptor subunit TctC
MSGIGRKLIGRWLASFLIVTALAAVPARAADYPDRPIHIVVPTGAGGITDVLARIVADKLSHEVGQGVVVDNRPGASGIIGSTYVAHAAPDGYTLLFAYPTHALNPSLYAKLPYDTLNDFVPVTMVGILPVVLVVEASSPAKDIRDLIATAKQEPDSLRYSSVGNGSLGSVAAELFAMDAGIKITQIAYKGTPQAAMGLLTGDTALFFDAPLTILPLIASGKVRALGVTSKTRLPSLPDVPAISEIVPGYEALGWNGILAPAGTPPAIVDRLNKSIAQILKDPDTAQQLADKGIQVVGDTPQEFAAVIKADVAKWGVVVKAAGIVAQ